MNLFFLLHEFSFHAAQIFRSQYQLVRKEDEKVDNVRIIRNNSFLYENTFLSNKRFRASVVWCGLQARCKCRSRRFA